MSFQRDLVTRWLDELNRQWRVDCMGLDTHGECHLVLGGSKISFAISDDDHELLLWSPVIPAHSFLADAELLAKLLMLNGEEGSLSGAAASIDRERRFVLLTYRAPINGLDAQAFGELLRWFGEVVVGAGTLLSDLVMQQDRGGQEPPQFGADMTMMRP